MKAVLNVVRKLSRRIEDDFEKIARLRALREAIVPELDGLPKNFSGMSRVEGIAVRIADLEAEVSELKAVLILCRIELSDWLSEKIPASETAKILFYRYGLLKKFNEIASELHYSESSVFRLHRLGLLVLGIKAKLSANYEFDH